MLWFGLILISMFYVEALKNDATGRPLDLIAKPFRDDNIPIVADGSVVTSWD